MTISKPADAIENRCIAGFKALQESCNAIHPVTLTAVSNATVTTDKYDIYRHYSTISERLVTVIVGSTPQRSKTASGERLTQTASCLVEIVPITSNGLLEISHASLSVAPTLFEEMIINSRVWLKLL